MSAILGTTVLIPLPLPSILVVRTGILARKETRRVRQHFGSARTGEISAHSSSLVTVELVVHVTTDVNHSHVGQKRCDLTL